MKRATDHLQTLVQDIYDQTPKTLAYWRVTCEPIYKILQDFAAKDSDDANPQLDTLLPQVQALFDALDIQLSLQEKEDADYQAYLKVSSSTAVSKTNPFASKVFVVFGGKYPAEGKARSISERLVTKLVQGESKSSAGTVITVSRSRISYALPENCKHVALQNLDHDDASVGSADFGQVLEMVGPESKKTNGEEGSSDMTLHLTLGQHKGVNPFCRNLQGAHNFCVALEQYMTTTVDGKKRKDDCNWRVVLTGTDATLPSDHPASTLILSEESVQIPSYKIMHYNFVYAMSKLGQCLMIIKTVAKLVDRADLVLEVQPIVAKIQANVRKAGENGNYCPPVDEAPLSEKEAYISMDQLDQYSRRSMELEQELRDHLHFAKGISICYTPLHALPWSQQALKSDIGLSPKAFVLEQVVKRLKNAISIDRAVECHFI